MIRRLIIVTRYYHEQNGLGAHTRFLRQALSQVGVKSEVLVVRAGKKGTCQEEEGLTYVNSWPGAVRYLFRSRKGTYMLFQWVPHMWGRGGIAPVAAFFPWAVRGLGVGVVVFLHELYEPLRPFSVRRCVRSLAQRLQLLLVAVAAEGVVVTTKKRAKIVQMFYRRVQVVPAGTILSLMPSTPPAPAEAIIPREPYVLWFGRPSVDNALDEVLDSMVGWPPEIQLIVAGNWPEGPGRDRMIERMSLMASVRFLEALPDEQIALLFRHTSLYISSLRSGPSGRRTTVAAAMAAGACMIAMDGPETGEEFESGRNCLLIPCEAARIAEAVRNLWFYPEERRRLGEALLRLHLHTTHPDVLAGNIKRFIEQIRSS